MGQEAFVGFSILARFLSLRVLRKDLPTKKKKPPKLFLMPPSETSSLKFLSVKTLDSLFLFFLK